jgi:hypothetical protein
MIKRTSNRRSDEQLASILHETARWTVIGQQGKILHETASLHCALEQAAEFAASGKRVVALVRREQPEIVVFSGQFQKLMRNLPRPDEYLTARPSMKG